MSPDAYNDPSLGPQSVVCVSIALPIGENLVAPELRVLFGPCGVYGTAVPEAAIDEYCDSKIGEGHVRNPTWLDQHWHLNAVTEAQRMKFTSEGRFGRRVPLPDSPHAVSGLKRGRSDAPDRSVQVSDSASLVAA